MLLFRQLQGQEQLMMLVLNVLIGEVAAAITPLHTTAQNLRNDQSVGGV